MLERGCAVIRAKQAHVVVTAAICAGLIVSEAGAETLAELVKKEEGIEFGACNLTPRPKVAGKEVHVVVPARFDNPGIWVTRTVLFVGVDDAKNVAGIAEAKALHDIAPREVISVTCNKSTVTVRMTDRMKPKTLTYAWDGKGLRKK